MKTIQCPKCKNDILGQGSGQLTTIVGDVNTSSDPMYVFYCMDCGSKLYISIVNGPYSGKIKDMTEGKLTDFVDTDDLAGPPWPVLRDQYKPYIQLKAGK